MRRAMALLGGVGLLAFGVGGPATAGDEPGAGPFRPPSPSRPACREFDVEVLVAGRPLEAEDRDGLRFVRAVAGADYELRITNPLPVRVAVALSVDGLNTIDARSTGVWDASKWIVHPYQPLTVSGWQVGAERARRFYFTREGDSYAGRLGRPGDFGVIRAVFFRERRPPLVLAPRELRVGSAPREALSATEGHPATAQPEDAEAWRRRDERPWYDPGRAATGIGRSERSEVDVVDLALEREPVAEVEVRYAYRPPWHRPEVVPRPAPAPETRFRRGPATGPEERRFCPEP